jgi:hypothetical protein
MLLLGEAAAAQEIKKWVDADGRVHYGDKDSVVDPVRVEEFQVEDTFDPQAYDEARQRQEELKEELDKIDAQREEEAKREQELETLKKSQPARRPSTVINLPQPYYEIPPNAPGYPGIGIGNRPRPTPLPAQR